MLPAVGCVTASANAVATVASTAEPPAAITSAPTRDATSLCDATIPRVDRVGTAPAVSDTAATKRATAVRECVFIGRADYRLVLVIDSYCEHYCDYYRRRHSRPGRSADRGERERPSESFASDPTGRPGLRPATRTPRAGRT